MESKFIFLPCNKIMRFTIKTDRSRLQSRKESFEAVLHPAVFCQTLDILQHVENIN